MSVKDHLLDQLAIERALGVRWDVGSDTFGFKITLKDRPSTRRGILSVVVQSTTHWDSLHCLSFQPNVYSRTCAGKVQGGIPKFGTMILLSGRIGSKIFQGESLLRLSDASSWLTLEKLHPVRFIILLMPASLRMALFHIFASRTHKASTVRFSSANPDCHLSSS